MDIPTKKSPFTVQPAAVTGALSITRRHVPPVRSPPCEIDGPPLDQMAAIPRKRCSTTGQRRSKRHRFPATPTLSAPPPQRRIAPCPHASLNNQTNWIDGLPLC